MWRGMGARAPPYNVHRPPRYIMHAYDWFRSDTPFSGLAQNYYIPLLYLGRLPACAVVGAEVSLRNLIDTAKKAHRQKIAAEAEFNPSR